MVMNNNNNNSNNTMTGAHSIVQLNNGGLSHFINRDYEKAIVMLRRAYEVFEVCAQLQDIKTSESSSPSSSSSSSSSAMDMDTTETTTTTTTSSSSSSSNSAPTRRSSVMQADCSDNGSIQFMQYDMNDDDESSSSSSSASSSLSSHQEQQHHHQHHQQQELPTARKVGGLFSGFEMDSTLFKEKVVRSSQVEPTCNYACSPDTAYSMYNRALVLSNDENEYSLIIANKYRTAAIILYNLALVHHTIGIQLGVSAALPHAIRLYEMALESIIVGCTTTTTQSSTTSSIQNLCLLGVEKLFMALLNNLGNIYTHIFEYENAQRCFNHLRIVLSAFGGGCGSGESPPIATADEEYAFFFLNAIFQGKELCIAPAA